MKKLIVVPFFVIAILPNLLAATEASIASGGSPFHLLSFKCEPGDGGAQSTPQSPPLNVDDPSTPGCNRWELNILAAADMTHNENTWEVPLLDINYGIGDNIQLKYEVPYMSVSTPNLSTAAMGESKAGVKYMFFEDETSDTQIAVYPQASFVSSTSDAVQRGLTTPGSIITMPVLLSTRLGKTSRGNIDLTANVGYNISTKSDTTNFFSGAVGVGTPISTRIALMSELATEQGVGNITDEPRQNLLLSNVGVIGTVNRNFFLFGSVGHSLYSSDQESHSYALGGMRLVIDGF